MDYLELIARVASYIPDKGWVIVRYYGLYANALRGRVRKAGCVCVIKGMIEEDRLFSLGWADKIWKVYEAAPLGGGWMKVMAFLTESAD